jgi:hypothetical protein
LEFGGTYTLGPTIFAAGPNVAGQYQATFNAVSFFAFGGDGNFLIGVPSWDFLQDNTPNPKFFGNLTIIRSTGTADFVSNWPAGAIDPIELTTQSLGESLGRVGSFSPFDCRNDRGIFRGADGGGSRPHRRCRTAGLDLGWRWPSRLVATTAENRLNISARNYHTSLRQPAIAEQSNL